MVLIPGNFSFKYITFGTCMFDTQVTRKDYLVFRIAERLKDKCIKEQIK